MAHTRGALEDIRVLELGNFIAAPTAGRILADFGADVIKVERPRTGDELRNWRLRAGDTSLLFRSVARSKRSLTLDLRTDEGREIALKLIARTDIVLENFRPGTLEKWGLGEDALREVNPDLVFVRVSGFGQTGPNSHLAGFGAVAEAYGGLRHLTGEPGQTPVRTGVSLADFVAGLYAVVGALIGIIGKRSGRGGETVDVALYEAIYSMLESTLPDYSAFGTIRGALGSKMPGVCPSGTYLCSDGKYIVIAGNGDAIYGRFMNVVGRPDLGTDIALQTNAGRVERETEIDAAISDWAVSLDSKAALQLLADAFVPSGPINTIEDLADDPHLEARGMNERHSIRIDADTEQEVLFPGIVPRLSAAPGRTRWMGPDLGSHTKDVLTEIGYDTDHIEAFDTKGVI
ncbi:CoA transferase [Rhodococcoides fascians A25f]|uniref:CaiB/BaiF CoA transferase family protein n=1 Tax=Rhodococcoides fascians TaxID=1828 RepID=UPI00055AE90A|nr:CoA transferase [Rhodococcus fascians]QII07290.1 CoA transferase [Rhodococcus fascians A25f]